MRGKSGSGGSNNRVAAAPTEGVEPDRPAGTRPSQSVKALPPHSRTGCSHATPRRRPAAANCYAAAARASRRVTACAFAAAVVFCFLGAAAGYRVVRLARIRQCLRQLCRMARLVGARGRERERERERGAAGVFPSASRGAPAVPLGCRRSSARRPRPCRAWAAGLCAARARSCRVVGAGAVCLCVQGLMRAPVPAPMRAPLGSGGQRVR